LLSRFQRRQLVLELLLFLVLAFMRFDVQLEEAIEFGHRTRHTEPEASVRSSCVDIDSSLVEDCSIHLRRNKTLPDQLVDLVLIFFQVSLDLIRMALGRMASCASCAPFFDLKVLGDSGK